VLKDLPDKVQKVVKDSVASYPAKWGSTGVCAFQMFDRNSGKGLGGRSSGGECHASLSYSRGVAEGAENCILVNAHKDSWHKTNREFLRWILCESPFSHGVINDDEEEMLKRASVIDVEEVGVGGALWLCKASRHFTEDTWKPDIWDKLRTEGLNGLQAFIGSDILQASGQPSYGNTHVSLFSYMPPTNLRKIYDEVRGLKKIEDSKANRGGYGGSYSYAANRTWGSLAGKSVKKPDGWGGYVEVLQPCEAKVYAGLLREIFEGDPKNVK
jgi:hypothetical protein